MSDVVHRLYQSLEGADTTARRLRDHGETNGIKDHGQEMSVAIQNLMNKNLEFNRAHQGIPSRPAGSRLGQTVGASVV